MPVRIYEIAKNLGIQSKDVLAKAKELNISNAKVASSSLDKITAEYLEEQLSKDLKPEVTEANDSTDIVDEKPAVEPAPSGPVLIVANKEEETEEPPSEEDESTLEEPTTETPADEKQNEAKSAPTETEPAAGPKVGQQVGFVDLGNLAPRREQRRHEKKDKRQNPNSRY